MATSSSFSIKYLSLMFIDFRKFLNVFIFSVTKPREVTSRNINWKFDGGVRSSLLISLYLVSLYSRDFVVLVSQGQVNSITVNVSLVSMAISGLARCNRSFCCEPVVLRLWCRDFRNLRCQHTNENRNKLFLADGYKNLNYRFLSPRISIECL